MSRKILIFLTLIIFSQFLLFCSDDDNPTIVDNNQQPQEPTLKEITIPQELASKQNPFAQMAVGFMHAANGFKAFSNFFIPPDQTALLKTSEDINYNWMVGNLSITLQYTEENNVGWKIILNGTDGVNVFTNWLYLEGSQSLDGSTGNIICNKEVTTEIDAVWEWSIDQLGVYTMTMIFNDDFDKVVIVDNGDLSGLITHFEYHEGVYKLLEKIQHNTDMSGEYWVYDLDGNLETHGYWD